MNIDNEAIIEALINTSTATHYGLPVVEVDGCEYAIARDDDEVLTACRENIEDMLWACSTSFLLRHMSIPAAFEPALKAIQHDQCESCNDMIRECIADMDALVQEAYDTDGAGHFLSAYDGNEDEYLGAIWFRIS